MNRLPTKDEIIAVVIRAIHTAAQSFLAFITIGKAFGEIDWMKALSVAGVAAIYSIVKSIAIGTPETSTAGTLVISDGDDGKVNWNFNVDQPLDDIAKGSIVRLKINNTTEDGK